MLRRTSRRSAILSGVPRVAAEQSESFASPPPPPARDSPGHPIAPQCFDHAAPHRSRCGFFCSFEHVPVDRDDSFARLRAVLSSEVSITCPGQQPPQEVPVFNPLL